MSVWIAGRVFVGKQEIISRRLLKINPNDNYLSILLRLLHGHEEFNSRDVQPDNVDIMGYDDPYENKSTEVKFTINDNMNHIFNKKLKFFNFLIHNDSSNSNSQNFNKAFVNSTLSAKASIMERRNRQENQVNNENNESREDTLTCKCGEVMPNKAEYNQHLRTCTISGIKCPCGRLFASQCNFASHRRYCNTEFENGDDPLLKICECGESFSREAALLRHLKVCEIHKNFLSESNGKINDGKNSCVCGKVFLDQQSMELHAKHCTDGKKSKILDTRDDSSVGSDIKQESSKQIFSPGASVESHHEDHVSNAYDVVKLRRRRASDVSDTYGSEKADTHSGNNIRSTGSDHMSDNGIDKKKNNQRLSSKALRYVDGKKRPHGPSNDTDRKRRKKNNDSDDEYEVDMILLHSGSIENKDKLQFLIRWKGYDADEDRWLPYDECKDLKALDEYCGLHPELKYLTK
jgi:hypothetical protein